MERLARAMRLSPQDPRMFEMQTATACAHFLAGRDAEALAWAENGGAGTAEVRRSNAHLSGKLRHIRAAGTGAENNRVLARA